MRKICQCLCNVLMSSHYRNLVHRLHHPFSLLYFAERFAYWALECTFELFLPFHSRGIFAGWHNVELLAIRSRIFRVITSRARVSIEHGRVLAYFAFQRLRSLHTTPDTFKNFIFLMVWFGELRRESSRYTHLLCSSGWPELVLVRENLVIVAYWVSRRKYCFPFLRICVAISSSIMCSRCCATGALIWASAISHKPVLERFVGVAVSHRCTIMTLTHG